MIGALEMDEEEMKPCPMCGAAAIFVDLSGKKYVEAETGYVMCRCGCVEQTFVRNRKFAVIEWNRRFTDDTAGEST